MRYKVMFVIATDMEGWELDQLIQDAIFDHERVMIEPERPVMLQELPYGSVGDERLPEEA